MSSLQSYHTHTAQELMQFQNGLCSLLKYPIKADFDKECELFQSIFDKEKHPSSDFCSRIKELCERQDSFSLGKSFALGTHVLRSLKKKPEEESVLHSSILSINYDSYPLTNVVGVMCIAMLITAAGVMLFRDGRLPPFVMLRV